jgi:hypothetical protein
MNQIAVQPFVINIHPIQLQYILMVCIFNNPCVLSTCSSKYKGPMQKPLLKIRGTCTNGLCDNVNEYVQEIYRIFH